MPKGVKKVPVVKGANARQVGGTHYKTEFEHWDMAERAGLGYLESAATKYIGRWRKKDGVKDIQKALHYTEKLIELNAQIGRSNRTGKRVTTNALLEKYFAANELSPTEQHITTLLITWSNKDDLLEAVRLISALIQGAGFAQALAPLKMVLRSYGEEPREIASALSTSLAKAP